MCCHVSHFIIIHFLSMTWRICTEYSIFLSFLTWLTSLSPTLSLNTLFVRDHVHHHLFSCLHSHPPPQLLSSCSYSWRKRVIQSSWSPFLCCCTFLDSRASSSNTFATITVFHWEQEIVRVEWVQWMSQVRVKQVWLKQAFHLKELELKG